MTSMSVCPVSRVHFELTVQEKKVSKNTRMQTQQQEASIGCLYDNNIFGRVFIKQIDVYSKQGPRPAASLGCGPVHSFVR